MPASRPRADAAVPTTTVQPAARADLPPLHPPTFDPDRFLVRLRDFHYVGTPPSLLVQLRVGGIAVSPPEALTREEVERGLWDILHGLAQLNVFLLHTDHLSDGELYAELFSDVLLGEAVELPEGDPEMCAWHTIDLVGDGSDRHVDLYLRYYADDEMRRCWADDLPDEMIPPRETPPYDRDARLP